MSSIDNEIMILQETAYAKGKKCNPLNKLRPARKADWTQQEKIAAWKLAGQFIEEYQILLQEHLCKDGGGLLVWSSSDCFRHQTKKRKGAGETETSQMIICHSQRIYITQYRLEMEKSYRFRLFSMFSIFEPIELWSLKYFGLISSWKYFLLYFVDSLSIGLDLSDDLTLGEW